MSAAHLRQDKTCLNCGAEVQERYCTRCGQENTEPKESIGHLIGHFLSDITHYDSKFFTSLRDLFFKPGFLTSEYNAGRRTRYLNPVRMYVFISAIFFLVLFGGHEGGPPPPAAASSANTDTARASPPLTMADSLRKAKYTESMSFSVTDFVTHLGIVENKYHRIPEYDSIQSHLPDSTKEGTVSRFFTHRMIRLREKHPGTGVIEITQNIGQDIPKIMFILLPLFAAFVHLFYSRKRYWYTQHAIFSLHFHCFMFLLLLLVLLALKVIPSTIGEDFWVVLIMVSAVLLLIYLYLGLALAKAYRQPYWLSLLKALAIMFMYLVTLQLALLLVGFISFMTA